MLVRAGTCTAVLDARQNLDHTSPLYCSKLQRVKVLLSKVMAPEDDYSRLEGTGVLCCAARLGSSGQSGSSRDFATLSSLAKAML